MKKSLVLAILLQLLNFNFQFSTFAQVASESEMLVPQKVGNDEMIAVFAGDVLDGEYEIAVESSSSMFKITKALLSVKNGEMTVKITMSGKSYTKLFLGTALEASEAKGGYIEQSETSPVIFEFPVSGLNVPIKCAAFSSKKKKWYDRDILFDASSLPETSLVLSPVRQQKIPLKDGSYFCDVKLSGGSGRAGVKSPAKILVKGGLATSEIEWSSSTYDYMKVNREKYDLVNKDGISEGENSKFIIPVFAFDKKMPVLADTIAMSEPHEILYFLEFNLESARKDKGFPVLPLVVCLVVCGVILAGCTRIKKSMR